MKDVVTWDGGAVCGQELVLEGGEGGLDQQRHQEAECRRAAMNFFNLDNSTIGTSLYCNILQIPSDYKTGHFSKDPFKINSTKR